MAKGRRRRLKPIRLWREIPILLGIALLLALGIKTFMVQAFFIPSQSMQNTIMPGDRVLVNKFSPWFGAKPQRGQVVVFHDPGGWLEGTATPTSSNPIVRGIKDVFTFVGLLPSSDEHDLIKRVIAVGGDEVKCCDTQGRITVNGVPLDETSYLFPNAAPSTMPFDVKVAAGRIWVMGDNRGDSADSRYHMTGGSNGTVPVSDVVGHAFVLIWPPSRAGGLGVPATFHQEGLTVLPPAQELPATAAFLGVFPLRFLGRRWWRARSTQLLTDTRLRRGIGQAGRARRAGAARDDGGPGRLRRRVRRERLRARTSRGSGPGGRGRGDVRPW
ncbi:MAG TPA: signal peptidase I [Actinocrinis sp.]|uniref:signal peptidase I n=1 Tax=Actinocrinis sp. TaxID=1920516 RepID=UPI002DDD4EEF|nr:signal peptidase I [Actinocrinis sp.]HEV2345050.1 signal peptidase I [Actinocrinis sp.]